MGEQRRALIAGLILQEEFIRERRQELERLERIEQATKAIKSIDVEARVNQWAAPFKLPKGETR